MKFSSISLLAAALAAIAGGAMAAPGLPYARALEQVNTFERDLDVYPRESGVAVRERDVDVDDLFRRFQHTQPHQDDHIKAARLLLGGYHDNIEAATVAHATSNGHSRGSPERQEWRGISAHHTREANRLVPLYNEQRQLGAKDDVTDAHATVNKVKEIAGKSGYQARTTIRNAGHHR